MNYSSCILFAFTYEIVSQASGQFNLDHLEQFKFVGRIVGKALHDGFVSLAFYVRIY
jgi:hypothetical protein